MFVEGSPPVRSAQANCVELIACVWLGSDGSMSVASTWRTPIVFHTTFTNFGVFEPSMKASDGTLHCEAPVTRRCIERHVTRAYDPSIYHRDLDNIRVPTVNQTPPPISSMLGSARPLQERELRLILLLLADSRSTFKHRPRELRAYELDYMGSLLFERNDAAMTTAVLEQATFTSTLAKAVFSDRDDAIVEVRLDCDQFGNLYGLDIHKPTFRPLIEYPSRRTLRTRLMRAA